MNSSRIILILLIILLSIVSFYTSFDGLKQFAFASKESPSHVGIVIIAVLVLSIQLFLVYSLHRVAKTKQLKTRVAWLLPYLLTMLISVFFSYGFYYKLFRADGYAKDKFIEQLSSASNNAQKYLEAFEAIQEGGDQLKAYSLKRSNEEKQFGGTCGDHSPPGKGPRQLFRLQEAEKFNYIAENIKPLTQKVKSEIEELKKAIASYSPNIKDLAGFQRKLNDLVHRINANNTSFVLSYTKQAIRSRIGKNRENIIAENIGCPDDTISNSGNVMLQNITHLPVLKEIKLFNPNNDKEVLTRALQVFKSVPRIVSNLIFSDAQASKPVSGEKSKLILKKADFMPMILGAVIDFMLLIIGFTNGIQSRKDNWLSPAYEGEFFSALDARRIKNNTNLNNIVELLQPYLLKTFGGYYFFIPSTSIVGHPQSGKLLEMFEVLTTERIKPAYLRNIPYRWLPSSVKERLGRLYQNQIDDKQGFNIYRMNKAQWGEFKQVLNINELLSTLQAKIKTNPQTNSQTTKKNQEEPKDQKEKQTEPSNKSADK